jgi:hypothetical protein
VIEWSSTQQNFDGTEFGAGQAALCEPKAAAFGAASGIAKS